MSDRRQAEEELLRQHEVRVGAPLRRPYFPARGAAMILHPAALRSDERLVWGPDGRLRIERVRVLGKTRS
jgi:hypothetical protein